jgi:hypothetical protein
MSSIYGIGSVVRCPSAVLHGDVDVSGTIEGFKRGDHNTVFVKWSDGHQGYMKAIHLITADKYKQLEECGYKPSEIVEYLILFNGHIYN